MMKDGKASGRKVMCNAKEPTLGSVGAVSLKLFSGGTLSPGGGISGGRLLTTFQQSGRPTGTTAGSAPHDFRWFRDDDGWWLRLNNRHYPEGICFGPESTMQGSLCVSLTESVHPGQTKEACALTPPQEWAQGNTEFRLQLSIPHEGGANGGSRTRFQVAAMIMSVRPPLPPPPPSPPRLPPYPPGFIYIPIPKTVDEPFCALHWNIGCGDCDTRIKSMPAELKMLNGRSLRSLVEVCALFQGRGRGYRRAC